MMHTEPNLEQLLRDPLVHAVMRRDGLHPDQVRTVMTQARAARFARSRFH
ncbi:hypothetical protein JCM17960_16920 [Magnetospira thiophila]